MAFAGTGAEFNVWLGLLGLLPLVVYIILVFRGVDPLPATAVCVLLGAILTAQTMWTFGRAIQASLGSFLGLVGLIIMLGRGLGEVMNESKVSHTIVHNIMHTIGVNTQKKAMLGIIISSMVIVALLGTLAGGVAIIAPIIVPIAAAVGLTRSTVGVLFQAAGEEALILGPFTPPVVTLLGLSTRIGDFNYATMITHVCGPVALVTLCTTWFMANRIQKSTKGITDYEEIEDVEQFHPTTRNKLSTATFLICFILAVIYGIVSNAGTSLVIVIMLGLSLIVGMVSGLGLDKTFKLIIKGMAGNVSLFLTFLLLDPFLNFVEMAGGFKAVMIILAPVIDLGGKAAVVIAMGLTGAFGMPAAAVAVIKMLDSMFGGMVIKLGISVCAWAIGLVIATRVVNFVYPGANMFACMGFAESKDLRSMIKNGFAVAGAQVIFLIAYAYLWS